MAIKEILGLGLGAGALYFLAKNNAGFGNNNIVSNGNNTAPSAKAHTYSYGGPRSITTTQPSTQLLAKDGTPFRENFLYFGDKTKPYDEFYDYSDDYSRTATRHNLQVHKN